VFRATGLYLVAIWGLTSGAVEILPSFGVPGDVIDIGVVAAFCATPIVAVLAWLFDLRGGRLVRDHALPESISTATLLPGSTPSGVLTLEWQGERRVFPRDFVLGRDDVCDLQINDPMISRQHVRFFVDEGTWTLMDLGSSNGTRLDGQRVDRAALPRRSVVNLYDGGPDIEVTIATAHGKTEITPTQPSAAS